MATPIASFPACWPLLSLAETVTSDHASAACYRRIENIRVHAVVVSELKLGDIQRQIFFAHLMECADDTAFEDRPEALNRIRVNRANNVLAHFMVHFLARIFFQRVINAVIVGRQQANLVGNDFAHEALRGFGRNAFQDAGDDVALPLDCADDRGLAGACAARTLWRLCAWRL